MLNRLRAGSKEDGTRKIAKARHGDRAMEDTMSGNTEDEGDSGILGRVRKLFVTTFQALHIKAVGAEKTPLLS
jgi:hypothetical protein